MSIKWEQYSLLSVEKKLEYDFKFKPWQHYVATMFRTQVTTAMMMGLILSAIVMAVLLQKETVVAANSLSNISSLLNLSKYAVIALVTILIVDGVLLIVAVFKEDKWIKENCKR